MLNTQNPRKTRTLGKPADWDEAKMGPCDGLDVEDRVLATGAHCMVSLWTPTREDLEALQRGGSVRLHVYGTAHPPVWLDVETPPCVRADRGLQS